MNPIHAHSNATVELKYLDKNNNEQKVKLVLRNFNLQLQQDIQVLEDDDQAEGEIFEAAGVKYKAGSKIAVIHGFIEDYEHFEQNDRTDDETETEE